MVITSEKWVVTGVSVYSDTQKNFWMSKKHLDTGLLLLSVNVKKYTEHLSMKSCASLAMHDKNQCWLHDYQFKEDQWDKQQLRW
jgi:hypothetical protein